MELRLNFPAESVDFGGPGEGRPVDFQPSRKNTYQCNGLTIVARIIQGVVQFAGPLETPFPLSGTVVALTLSRQASAAPVHRRVLPTSFSQRNMSRRWGFSGDCATPGTNQRRDTQMVGSEPVRF
jgi:hypothetical protein